MKKLVSILFSNKLTLVALLAFGIAMAVATFIENDHGTAAARSVVYNTWWFEVLMAILTLNFIGNIIKYRLARKGKLDVLLFHLAFIIILIGAGITRYTGYEGLIRIREGQESSTMISQERYLRVNVHTKEDSWSTEKSVLATSLKQPKLKLSYGNSDSKLEIKVKKFIPDAVQTMVSGETDNKIIELVAVVNNERQSFYIENGNNVFINGHEFTYNNYKGDAINISDESGVFTIDSPEAFKYMVMATQRVGTTKKSIEDTLYLRTLYQSDHLNFVLSQVHEGKTLAYQSTKDKEQAKSAADLLFVDLNTAQEHKQIILATVDGVYSPLQDISVGNYDIEIAYGPKLIELPFALHLKDFQLERYPGSVSPSSYASEITVKDISGDYPYRISMNNVLDHRGYRFFQASYDLDELGTVLSVNRDYWGTQITYLGYLLMGVGMLLALFGKNSRFQQVNLKLKNLKTSAAMILLLVCSVAVAQSEESSSNPTSRYVINRGHAKKFGQTMVQDMDGRIKPINTLSSEFLRKITRKTTYKIEENGQSFTMNSDQVFLSIHQNPMAWRNMPLIKVDQKKGKTLLEMLNLEGKTHLSFVDLIDDEGGYRLLNAVQAVQLKKPSERSDQDNEILKVDERFNILYQALTGNYLKVFPQPTANDQMWFNSEFQQAGFSSEDSVFVRNILSAYYYDIMQAQLNGDWSEANSKLQYIQTFQNTMGAEIIPDKGRVEAELLYNKLNINNRLFPVFWLLGIYLLATALLRVFFKTRSINISYILGVALTGIAFLTLTGNMILRWYAGGYPPWSNGYEMIILVTWALFLFGFIFYRKSDFIMPLVAIFGGTLLFVSFLDWLNPEITNLVPVLKSYWLKIHVAIIVSSYAPLALSALLGLLCLIFMIAKNNKLNNSIKELTYINELSMTVGLYMLAIGTFLGGIWANESWGRYWGWDPKETWALISIIVYAMVLHFRLVPVLKGKYLFNLSSVIAFFSIIMTSFGVNYYLSGLHSYAAGDPLPIPQFVYWVVGLLVIIAILAYRRNKLQSVVIP